MSNPGVEPAEAICLECGLCCNGVIFARVPVQPADDVSRLKALGLNISRRAPHFPQPCSGFEGCRCRLYSERPHYCRDFECLLLKGIRERPTEKSRALEKIRRAREQAEKVRRLLRKLGDADELAALSTRFRRVVRRAENEGASGEIAGAFAELTLAFHDLNMLLSQEFYPADSRQPNAS